MSRGIGGIYRRGGMWWIRYSVDGVKRRESTHSSRKGDARKLLARRLGEIAEGRYQPDADKLTFADLDGMLADHYRDRRSRERALSACNHLRRHLGSYRVKLLTYDRLMRYTLDRGDERASPSTIKYELAVLHRGITLAVRSEKLSRVPAFPEIHVENVRQGFFEADEFAALIEELAPELRGLMEASYWTGWRIKSELLPLKWSQVDMTAGIVRLEPGTTKNGRGRTFPFGAFPALKAVFERQRTYTNTVQRQTGTIVPWVFHRSGKQIRTFQSAWSYACERAGLTDKVPHDFRRTAVRNLERSGVSRSVAMALVGHETEAIYRRYAITTERDLAEGVAKLATLGDAQGKHLRFSGTTRAQSG